MNNIEIDLPKDINTKADIILSSNEDIFINLLFNGGVNHTNILNIFSQICQELEFNKKIKQQLTLEIGSEKALIAIEMIKKILTKLKEVKPILSDNELKIIDFFLSEEGIMILTASTTLIVKTFKHISESYKQADLNKNGIVFGKAECSTFFKRLFCCHKSPNK
tara:strand:- start:500 stop:991 length:492 start_codon:yes stop_codon:yes gene_type:complete